MSGREQVALASRNVRKPVITKWIGYRPAGDSLLIRNSNVGTRDAAAISVDHTTGDAGIRCCRSDDLLNERRSSTRRKVRIAAVNRSDVVV